MDEKIYNLALTAWVQDQMRLAEEAYLSNDKGQVASAHYDGIMQALAKIEQRLLRDYDVMHIKK
jgi:NAD-dependent DNA ligase